MSNRMLYWAMACGLMLAAAAWAGPNRAGEQAGAADKPRPPAKGAEERADDASEKPQTRMVTFLGVAAWPVAPETSAQLQLPEGVGLAVQRVSKDSPAERAGLAVHDVLYKMDDQLLIHPQQLRTLVRIHKPGQTVKLTIYRAGKKQVVPVVLGQRSEPVGAWRPLGQGQALVTGPDGKVQVMRLPQLPQDVQKMLRQAFPDLVLPDGRNDKAAPQPGDQSAGKAQPGRPAPPQPQVRRFSTSTVTMMTTDGDHKLRLTIRDGVDKTLRVEDKEGKVIFEGLVNTPEERQALPPDILAKLEKLEKRMPKIRMRIGGQDVGPDEQASPNLGPVQADRSGGPML